MDKMIDVMNFIGSYLSNPIILLNLLVIVFASISLYHLHKAEKHLKLYHEAIEKNQEVFSKRLRELIEKGSKKS